jgi:hypothetical protein
MAIGIKSNFSKFIVLIVAASILTSCGSTSESVSSEDRFERESVLDFFAKNGEICAVKNMLPGSPFGRGWSTTDFTESIIYPWMTWDQSVDYFKFRINDPVEYHEFSVEDAVNGHKCSEQIGNEQTRISKFSSSESKLVLEKFRKFALIQESYTVVLDQIVEIPFESKYRGKFLTLENSRRRLLSDMESAFSQIRRLTDYSIMGDVKIFIEKCATSSRFHEVDGSLLLTNNSDVNQSFSFKIRFRDGDDLIVGDDLVFVDIPARSKMKENFSAYSTTTAVDGYAFPPSCSLD